MSLAPISYVDLALPGRLRCTFHTSSSVCAEIYLLYSRLYVQQKFVLPPVDFFFSFIYYYYFFFCILEARLNTHRARRPRRIHKICILAWAIKIYSDAHCTVYDSCIAYFSETQSYYFIVLNNVIQYCCTLRAASGG